MLYFNSFSGILENFCFLFSVLYVVHGFISVVVIYLNVYYSCCCNGKWHITFTDKMAVHWKMSTLLSHCFNGFVSSCYVVFRPIIIHHLSQLLSSKSFVQTTFWIQKFNKKPKLHQTTPWCWTFGISKSYSLSVLGVHIYKIYKYSIITIWGSYKLFYDNFVHKLS